MGFFDFKCRPGNRVQVQFLQDLSPFFLAGILMKEVER